MKNKQLPFEITHQIIDSVAQIAELVGRLTAVSSLPANPTLRRSNRIRTIHTFSRRPKTLPRSNMPMRFMNVWTSWTRTR